MRVLALIFALLGAATSGFMGMAALQGIKEIEAEVEAEKARPGGPRKIIDQERMAHLKRATYAMLAGIPLGVIGGVLALSRRGKLAAVLLALAYAAPVVILATGVGLDLSDKRVQVIVLFPICLLVAALLSLFIKPGIPYKPPGRRRDISEDDDLVG